jgi:pyruvate formate lyase activating enzyme
VTRPEAAWWEPASYGAVVCGLCPLRCRLRPERDAPCGTRGNRGGCMVPLQYGEVAACQVDPVEKKPLYHFHPGESILSIAARGCNLHCGFCQNWGLSQERGRGGRTTTPQDVVDLARREGSFAVAYTYSEPLVWFEFVRDCGRTVRAAGLKNVVVTNGFLEPGPLDELIPLLDAANVDLKAMDDRFYRRVCKARLEPVLASIRRLHAAGVHLEITNLVIPGHNDHEAGLRALVDFVAGLGRDVPLHFSAYRPAWQFTAPPTPTATLERAAAIAREKLDFVYLGNVIAGEGSRTRCPGCGAVVVERASGTRTVGLDAAGNCEGCGHRIVVR